MFSFHIFYFSLGCTSKIVYVFEKIPAGSDLLLNISLAGGQSLKVDRSRTRHTGDLYTCN